MHWHTASGALDLSVPLFLGILNVTPDSFSDGGCFLHPGLALEQARHLVTQGARMLDLGAESTRPGAKPLAASEEWERLRPVLDVFGQSLPGIPLSLDTRHPETARRCPRIAALNDVTGFSDETMLELARQSDCGLIAMRSRMREDALHMPEYGLAGFSTSDAAIQELRVVRDRLLDAGIAPERILLDPGFGFGTTFGEDLALWNALCDLPSKLDWPVERFCIGISRKRFLAWRADQPELPPKARDVLTEAAHQEAKALGYRVFRTHTMSANSLQ
jgi:dihydropteroate synthase